MNVEEKLDAVEEMRAERDAALDEVHQRGVSNATMALALGTLAGASLRHLNEDTDETAEHLRRLAEAHLTQGVQMLNIIGAMVSVMQETCFCIVTINGSSNEECDSCILNRKFIEKGLVATIEKYRELQR